jgi:hypothetical protein
MTKTIKPKPKSKAVKAKEAKARAKKAKEAKDKKAREAIKTIESKHAVIHNTINNIIHEKKTVKRKPSKKKVAQDNVASIQNGQVHYPHNQIPRTLDRNYNPDRFAEMYKQQTLPPSTYYNQHIAPAPKDAPDKLTDDLKKLIKQLDTKPTTPTQSTIKPIEPTAPTIQPPATQNIAEFPHVTGSRDYFVNQIMGSDEKYDQVDGSGNVVKTWNKAKLKALGTDGLRQFIHENKLAVEPEEKMSVAQRKAHKKESKADKKKERRKKNENNRFNALDDVNSSEDDLPSYSDMLRSHNKDKQKIEQENKIMDEKTIDVNKEHEKLTKIMKKIEIKNIKKKEQEQTGMTKPELIKMAIDQKKTNAKGKPFTEAQLKHSRFTIAKLKSML